MSLIVVLNISPSCSLVPRPVPSYPYLHWKNDTLFLGCLTSLGIEVVGPVFDDDSEEPAPSPLQVAAAMFKSKAKPLGEAASVGNRLAQPLHLPRMEVPKWYIS